jgi:hypothetical protein
MDLSAIGRQFGLDEAQTKAALDALVPVVAAGVRRNAQSPVGLQDILKSVLTGGHGVTLEDETAVAFDRAQPQGDDVLGQIFKSKDVSREVAQQLSATSGIGAAVLKKLLPIVASIVMGQVAKKMGGGGGGLGDILGDILGGGATPAPRRAPAPGGSGGGKSLEDILGDILNGGQGDRGGVAEKIPADQMGEILKDIFGGSIPGARQDGGASAPRPPSGPAVERGRKTLDDILGGSTRRGSAGDDLLNSVEDAIRRRR